jgi:hypothetical protein
LTRQYVGKQAFTVCRSEETEMTTLKRAASTIHARWLYALVVGCAAFGLLVGASQATAATASAHWRLQTASTPTSFSPEACAPGAEVSELVAYSCDRLAVRVTNVGTKPAFGGVTVTDTVSQGLRILTKEVEGSTRTMIDGEDLRTEARFPCDVSTPAGPPFGGVIECTYPEEVPAEDVLVVNIAVVVEVPDPGVLDENQAEVSGSGLNEESATNPVVLQQAQPFRFLDFGLGARDVGGEGSVQAGERPSLFTTDLGFPSRLAANIEVRKAELAQPVGYLRSALVYLPLGLAGNPQSTVRCPVVTFAALQANACPPASRIGTITWNNGGNVQSSVQNSSVTPGFIYNMVPEAGYPAEFGFAYFGRAVLLRASVVRIGGSGGDYALRVASTGIPKLAADPITQFTLSFWGTPWSRNGGVGSTEAFLTNPTNCSGPLSSKAVVETWENPGTWVESETTAYPQLTGCAGLTFSPHLTVQPELSTADTPSGYEAVLRIPQNKNAIPAVAAAQLKNAKVVLPSGVSLSPSAANGLVGCAQEGPQGINIGSSDIGPAGEDRGNPEATELGNGYPGGGNGSLYDDGLYHTAAGHCPGASQIGTVEVKTPLLEQPLTGHIYVAKPNCSPCTEADAADGKLYGIYVEASGSGVNVKLHGEVSANPTTGQLTATFGENPQLPFEEFRLKFDGGPAAALANPQACGAYATETDMTPWSTPQTPDATPKDTFSIGAGANGSRCVSSEAEEPNAPTFEAGTTSPLAGTFSPFVLKVKREDGTQRLERINATLPPGLLGRLAGIPYCSDAQIASASTRSGTEEIAGPSCPAASEVGTVTVAAGPGTKPYYVHGHAYLAGPYKGAPLSLEIITPAVAGPFDLGTVAVRTALNVNEETAQISAKSDPIPRILDGTPLDVRSISLELKRDQFTLNPTDCETASIRGEVVSAAGQTAALSNRFQVGGCGALAFKPELKLAFSGQTKRTGFPAVKAVLTQPKGENANISGATVILPKGMLIANAHINNPCTRVQFNSTSVPGGGCPAKSILGTAKVWTPLLEKPEEGNVYFRSNGGERKLPDLVVALRGQIPLQLVGFIDSVGEKGAEVRRVRSRFLNLPDAPVSRFELKLSGGKKGLLQNSTNLCKGKSPAKFQLAGQNGKAYDTEPNVQVGCRKGKKKQKSKKSGGK